MSKVQFNEICDLCNCIVSIWGDDNIEVTDTTIPLYSSGCDHSKNGYCGIFRAQAVLDKIEFNMHDRGCDKNN